jgi:HKD family nuclease
MAQISLIGPLDQPLGTRRLLDELKAALADPAFERFRLIVAFAKSGPLLRLKSLIDAWNTAGRRIEAIIGVDHHGTSRQALELAIELFDAVYVTREPGITFHPKIYLFDGPAAARCFIGSNNLTVGGTETNFETSVRIDIALAADAAVWTSMETIWSSLLPVNCPATKELNSAALDQLVVDGVVPDESAMRTAASLGISTRTTAATTAPPKNVRSGLSVKPPTALPRQLMLRGVSKKIKPTPALEPTTTPATPSEASTIAATAEGFAIQIKPHHNGEIILSVTAALQNPAFFKWPFTGRTTPKKPSNPSYPQLDPDPRVNITVYGAAPAPVLTLTDYALNTVYYSTKSEIRITASPLVGIVPDYSVMIMYKGNEPAIDYEIVIHRPDSPEYSAWLAACNQSMPGGGKTPRKFGWF